MGTLLSALLACTAGTEKIFEVYAAFDDLCLSQQDGACTLTTQIDCVAPNTWTGPGTVPPPSF